MRIAFTTELPRQGFIRLAGHTLYAPFQEAEVLVSTFDAKVSREMMKRTAYLINTARGAHVDEAALVEALQNGIIAGARM